MSREPDGRPSPPHSGTDAPPVDAPIPAPGLVSADGPPADDRAIHVRGGLVGDPPAGPGGPADVRPEAEPADPAIPARRIVAPESVAEPAPPPGDPGPAPPALVAEYTPAPSRADADGGPGVPPAVRPAGEAVPLRFRESPYKGTDSFKVEDRDLFFGREREAVTLTSRILGARCTLLYARSGVGKTSLLNARVIPMLEAKGWTPVPVRLDTHPLESIRQSTLRWVVPPPATEARALESARDALAPGADPTLLELLQAYEALPVRKPERRELIRPVPLPEAPLYLGYPASGVAMPFFSRLLRRSIDAPRFVEHLRLTGEFGGGTVAVPAPSEATVDGLLALLRHPAYEDGYRELVAELTGPVGDLQGFLANLVEVWGTRHAQFGLVLLLDQFEELFTLFADSRLSVEAAADGGVPRWQVRRQFLRELEGVYTSRRGERGSLLPVRLVIGMREEFIAQLDSVRHFVPELDESSFRLSLLDRVSARDAIVNPARDFGVRYETAALDAVLHGLLLEEEFVAPVTLQIVCDSLWAELRRRDEEAWRDGTPAPEPVITPEYIDAVGRERGVLGILEGFFDRFLESLGSGARRTEVLDILSQLITSSGTRNIVLRSELERVRYRVPGVRAEMLRELVEAGIVRVERRLGSEFVEVMHEFLIGPILQRVRATLGRDPDYLRLQSALRTLRRWEHMDRGGGATLTREELEEIRASLGSLELPRWGPELLLRSALACGHQLEDFAGFVRLAPTWFAQVKGAEPVVAELLGTIDDRAVRERWFAPEELAAINRDRAGLTLTPAQTRFVWESTLRRAHDGDEEDIRYWTRTTAATHA